MSPQPRLKSPTPTVTPAPIGVQARIAGRATDVSPTFRSKKSGAPVPCVPAKSGGQIRLVERASGDPGRVRSLANYSTTIDHFRVSPDSKLSAKIVSTALQSYEPESRLPLSAVRVDLN